MYILVLSEYVGDINLYFLVIVQSTHRSARHVTEVCFAPDQMMKQKFSKIMKNSSLLSSPKVLFKIIEGVLHFFSTDFALSRW